MVALQEIEDYFVSLLNEGYDIHYPEYADRLKDKFNLKIVSTTGTTRVIFKKKSSRKVIKVGCPSHNRAEYAAYKSLECSLLGDLLAPCTGISSKGYALEMEYIPKAIPSSKTTWYWFSPAFNDLRESLESNFNFIKGYNTYSWAADFHEENMRMRHDGEVKIVDYSSLLYSMFLMRKSTTIKSAIRGVCKLDFPRTQAKLYVKGNHICYEDDYTSHQVNLFKWGKECN